MSDWIVMNKRSPIDGQPVIYYFEFCGVNRGHFAAPDTFYGRKGFLGGDVTHWMPDEGQELPAPPDSATAPTESK